jgi:hypothetical protein
LAKVVRQDRDSKEYTISVATGVSIAPATARDSNPEFAKFADLTRKLTQVPKAEVDEKRKA